MATFFSNTPIAHTDDATFRTWGLELSTALQGLSGLTLEDTNINWVTVSRPGTNTAAGYEIYSFDDALQGAAPVFFKLEYGTASNINNPGIWLTVGQGEDGSGNITGIQTTRNQGSTNALLSSTTTNYPTRACFVDGQFWLSWKGGGTAATAAAGGGLGFIGIFRSVNSSGAPSADGVRVYTRGIGVAAGTALQSQTLSYTYSVATTITPNALTTLRGASHSLLVDGVSVSLVGATSQVYKHYAGFTRAQPLIGCLSYLDSEILAGYGPFPATPVGSSQRQYIALGGAAVANTCAGTPANGATSLACIWE